jgi:hypothetical protein
MVRGMSPATNSIRPAETQGATALAEKLNIPKTRAAEFLQRFRHTYPSVRKGHSAAPAGLPVL